MIDFLYELPEKLLLEGFSIFLEKYGVKAYPIKFKVLKYYKNNTKQIYFEASKSFYKKRTKYLKVIDESLHKLMSDDNININSDYFISAKIDGSNNIFKIKNLQNANFVAYSGNKQVNNDNMLLIFHNICKNLARNKTINQLLK